MGYSVEVSACTVSVCVCVNISSLTMNIPGCAASFVYIILI